MPVARFQMPDGRIARFEVPEGTTPEQAQEMISKSLESGPPQRSDISAQQAADRELYNPAKGMSGLEAFGVSMGKGLTDIGRGLGLAQPASEAEITGMEQLSKERPIASGAGEIIGQALPFAPVAIGASMAAPLAGLGATGTQALNIAGQGLVGAAEGGTIARGTGQDVMGSALTGGAVAAGIEAVSPVLGRAVSSVFRKLTGKAPKGALLTPDGVPSKELQDALQANGLSFDDLAEEAKRLIDPQAANADEVARKAFLESQGITPTRAQVTRGASDFQAQQEAFKTSNRVRSALEAQEAALTSRFNNAVIETGGQSSSPTSTVVDSVLNKASKLDNEVSRLYKMARDVAPDAKNVKFSNTEKTLRRLAPSNEATGGAIRSIVGDLQSRGILDKGMKATGKVDVKTAEETRKFINSLYDPQNTFRNGLLREIKDALDDDVFQSAGDDVFKEARKAKASFEGDLARAKVSKFDSRKSNLVRDVLENKVNPDRFVDDVVRSKKWRADDLDQLKNYISTDDAGKAAFNDLRAETLESIKNKAFIGPADEAGNKALSRDALEKELRAIGKPKLEVLFTPKEMKFLEDMLQVAKLREPVRGTALGRGPSAQAVAKLEQKLKDIPIMGSIVNFINIDAQGRVALKANPARAARIPLPYEKEVGSAFGAVAVPYSIQENQR